MPLLWAERWAGELASLLRPACERIQIAGSIRRRRQDVADIELVMVPLYSEVPAEPTLFDSGRTTEVNLLDLICRELKLRGVLADRPDKNGHIAWGEKFRRTVYQKGDVAFPADLFVVTPPAQWGVVFLLRTGPAEFNTRLVTARSQGGWCPDDLVFHSGALYQCDPLERDLVRQGVRPGELVPTPEEWDVFHALGIAPIPPSARRD